MIVIITLITIVCVIVIYKGIQNIKREQKRCRELEEMLDRYYKDRELRLNNMHKNK